MGQDVCDNRIEGEKGEKPGPFFGFGLVLYTYTLAEKVCGADITSLRSQTLEAAQRAGCGPGTEMYTSLDDYFGKMDELDLRALAEDGRTGPPMSDDEVRVWAQTVVDELGGCEALLGFVDETQNGTSER